VLGKETEEFATAIVRIQDGGTVVASPEAVVSGAGRHEPGARNARHVRRTSKQWAEEAPGQFAGERESWNYQRSGPEAIVRHRHGHRDQRPGPPRGEAVAVACWSSRGSVRKMTSQKGVDTPKRAPGDLKWWR
jgi:hypothetical protein